MIDLNAQPRMAMVLSIAALRGLDPDRIAHLAARDNKELHIVDATFKGGITDIPYTSRWAEVAAHIELGGKVLKRRDA